MFLCFFNFVYFILFKHLSKVAQFIITIRIDCIRELKKGAPKVFKSAKMVPSDYSKIINKSGSKYLASLIYDDRKNTVGLPVNCQCLNELPAVLK